MLHSHTHTLLMASLQWFFRLLMLLIIFQGVCVVFYYTTDSPSPRDVQNRTLHLLRCLKLRHKFSIIQPAESIELKSFIQELSDYMNCPYKSNETEQELNRVRLQFCCNATGKFMLTRRNTAINQAIQYEQSKKKYKMTKELHSMLPEDIPWSGRRLGRCAVVGSSGILKNSSCGSEIDRADFVIRFNLAKINNSDVGLKTDLITFNPSQIVREYNDLETNPDPLVERVSVYGNAPLITAAFAHKLCTPTALKTLRVLQPIRPQQPVVFFNPYYMRPVNRFWKKRGLTELRLTSGFYLISTALELCEHVDVYGYWPFDIDLQEQPVPYHYYDDMTVNLGKHKLPEEFVRLLQLHNQGALTLHLQPCSSPEADLENPL